MSLHVAIYLFDDVEVLDFAGPYEVFTTASRVARRGEPQAAAPFVVSTVARELRPLRARAGLLVQPDSLLAQSAPIDVLIVPGGVVDAELLQPALSGWIAATAATARITASVCTGAFLLAAAGLLDSRRATTHWEDMADLRRRFPAVTAVADVSWVDEGRIVTSGGISAGIDMSLHLVERLAGRDLAEETARQMEYRWGEPARS